MLPTVASFPHVQPHQHRNPYHATNTVHPYDRNNVSLHTPLQRNDSSKPVFHSMPRTQLQHPHPVQRLDHQDLAGSKSSSHNVGEHALRRKTPSGTLSAGYDGTPGDTTIQPPASKHILVSSLESGKLLPPQNGLPIDNWAQPSLEQSVKNLNFPPVYKNDLNRGASGGMTQDVNGTGWVRSMNYVPGMDSVLNQTLPMQPSQRFFLPNGPYVPTVLPSTLQPCVGPTASAGAGPYGPYWPDGAYIPYRPAALRDSRFDSPNPFPRQLAPPDLQLYNHSHSPFSHGSIPSNHQNTNLAWNQPFMGTLNQDIPTPTNFPPRHVDQKSVDNTQNHHVLPFHTRQHNVGTGYPSQQHNDYGWSGSQFNQPFQTPPSSRTANLEFKEKIFSWAHGVYVDLLATIHQARRNSMSSANANGQVQRPPKPSIYPKPPRQPGLDFSQSSTPATVRHNSYPSSQHDLHTQKTPDVHGQRQSETPFGVNRHKRPSVGQLQNASDTQMLDSLRRHGRYSGSISAPRFSGSPLNESSTSANAMSALEMLSHLCSESGWEWIDGMLLGGCLAYGLGDYNKAIRWYSRIIGRDGT